MSFRPVVGQHLLIDGVKYYFAEHPSIPGMPYAQEGCHAVVYQLIAGTERRALKVFKPRYRLPLLVSLAEGLAVFADFPGLSVCHRTVLTPQRHGAILRQHPELIYAILMPWIDGPTWMQVLIERRTLTPEQSLALARSLATVLAAMEQRGVAHCDLSGPNVLLPGLATADTEQEGQRKVALVDVEQLFGSGLEHPVMPPGGPPGYAHKAAAEGLWGPEADRFAGAVLLAEMLGWCDERVRQAAWGESYFEPQEMQHDGERYRVLNQVLTERWNSDLAVLLGRAWFSDLPADCPTFSEWQLALQVESPAQSFASQAGSDTLGVSTEKDVTLLLAHARQLESNGDRRAALKAYRKLLRTLPPGSGLREEVSLIVQELEKAPRVGKPDRATRREGGDDSSAGRPLKHASIWLSLSIAAMVIVAALLVWLVGFRGAWPAPVPTTGIPARQSTTTAQRVVDTPTAVPTSPGPTSTQQATPTVGIPVARVVVSKTALRSGPGQEYDQVGELSRGEQVQIVAQVETSKAELWLLVVYKGNSAWVSAGTVEVSTGLASVPTAATLPPTPPTSTPKPRSAFPTPQPIGNRPPVIRALACPVPAIRVEEDALFTCDAYDPDGDALTYEWFVDGIRQTAAGSQFSFLGRSTCRCVIRVIVRDGHGGEASAERMIEVIPPAYPRPTRRP